MKRGGIRIDSATTAALRLANPEAGGEARVAAVSLPLPMRGPVPAGLAGLQTQAVDLAWWPDSRSGGRRVPRRRLLLGIADGPLKASYRLGKPAAPKRPACPVEASLRIVSSSYGALLPHEVGEIRLGGGGRTLGLRLGVRWRDELHWWEWVRLEKLWSGPVATAYRAGGCIEVVPLTWESFINHPTLPPNQAILRSPWLHRQDWLFGEALIICFANGVVQVTCRHVNNHRFDEGRDQEDITPLIGFSVEGEGACDEVLDGSRARFDLGGVALDLGDASPLVSPAHTGSLKREGDLVLYQPYEGVEIAGDHSHRKREDSYHVRAADRRMPKGVARTVRLGLGFGAAAPAVARLTAPEWWYALNGDLWPDGALPVHDGWNRRIDAVYADTALDKRGRFDEGIMGYSWEGEVPYSQLRYYYRTGNPEHWRRALRDAYHIADIAFDHSTETIRMHDYPLDGSIAPPLFRTVGMLFGYLETGDPYLLDCAESAASHWYWMDRHMWPRYATGRDGASIRSLVFLWDYTGKEAYAEMAREAMGRVAQTQEADGGYRDQGSGTGIHGSSHMPVKPWMANLASDPMIDYLERVPGGRDRELTASLKKYFDFLMRTGVQPDGSVGWPYQVRYGDSLFDPMLAYRAGTEEGGKLPTGRPMAHGHKARALSFATRLSGDPAYFDAWLKFYNEHWANASSGAMCYHGFNKSLQHLPYAQAHAWNAAWIRGRLRLDPIPSEVRQELEGTIFTPLGPLALKLRQVEVGGRKVWELVERRGDKRIRISGVRAGRS